MTMKYISETRIYCCVQSLIQIIRLNHYYAAITDKRCFDHCTIQTKIDPTKIQLSFILHVNESY